MHRAGAVPVSARFRVLGPLAVEVDGRLVEPPGGRPHLFLAALLLRRDEGLTESALRELLSEEGQAVLGESTVRTYVTRVRQFLRGIDPGYDVTLRPQGYVLAAEGATFDRDDFGGLIATARDATAAGDPVRAADAAGRALDLWRGDAYGTAGDRPLFLPEVRRLTDERWSALELRAAALLEQGRADEVTGELLAAVDQEPLREELRRLLMLALARADRHVEALRAYESYRRELVEIGAEPSSRLRSLEQRIVRQDPSLGGAERPTGPGRWALPAELATTSDLVGREDELADLEAAIADASTGGSGLVTVSGEAGVGKTHLVAAAAQRAQVAGAIVLYGACDENLPAPFAAFVRALRGFREQGGSWSDELLHPWWPELARLVPEARTPGADPAPAGPLTDPQTEVLQLLDAIVGWLRAVSRHAAVVLVLEDVHWAADPTLLALKRVAEARELSGVLVLATIREPEPNRNPLLDDVLVAARRTRSLRKEISLVGLSVAEVHDLARALREDLDVDEDFAHSVREVTSGNPLFVTELVADLTDAELPADRTTLPSAGHLVARRLRQVDAAVAEVMAEAAIIGADVPLDLLVSASAADGEAVLRAMDAAIDAGLLVVVPGPRQRMRFTHAVVREALVGQLGRAERVAIHRRVAAALLALPTAARATYVEDLARHAYEASVIDGPSVAIGPIVAAGDNALEQRAYRHAADWYARALDLADRGGVVDASGRANLLVSMGDAQRRAGDPSFRESILHAAELARAEGDGVGLARAALIGSRGFYRQTAVPDLRWIALLEEAVAASEDASEATRALLLASLASELVWGDPDERRFALSDEAVALARASGDAGVLGQVLVLRLTSVWSPDRVDDCQATVEEALDVTASIGDRALRCHALRFASGLALEMGRREEALARMDLADELTDEVAQPDLTWHLRLARSSWSLLDGRLATAREEAYSSLRIGQAIGEPEALPFFGAIDLEIRRVEGTLPDIIGVVAQQAESLPNDPAYGLLRHLAAGGERAMAHTGYREAVADLGAITQGVHTLAALCNLAYLAAWFADAEAAPALYDLLAPYADRHAQAIVVLPVGHHHLGLLASTAGRPTDAEEHFASALEAHRRLGAPLHEAETHLEWGRHLARQSTDERASAEEHVATARRIAEEHGASGLVLAL